MYKKRRFKPIQKKMISLGLAAAMLMAVPSQNMLSYAMTDQSVQDEDVQEQSVESESGYRLYADELTSASGAVKGDMTEVLPGYEIINVKLPDGSLAKPEEVNFPVTESGDYVFEVIYHSASNGTDPAKTAEAQTEAIQSEDAQSAEEQSLEQGVEEQSTSDVLPESAGDTESEELTLTVTLPEEVATEEPASEERAEPVEEEIQSAASESEGAAVRSSAPAATRSSASSISTRVGGFGDNGWATSDKTWAESDFPTAYGYGSNAHMNYSSDPGKDTIIELPAKKSFESGRGVQFTFGSAMGTERYGAHWLQQGSAFSEITFDFTKDFALEGFMRVGDAFGCTDTDSPYSINMEIDGGVTISFIPTSEMKKAADNAALAKGAAYRLGAYGTLPNSIVCEFDVGTDDYYKPNDSRNFGISEDDIHRTGDYYYATGTGVNAFPALNGLDIYNQAKEPNNGGNGLQNATHIGISTTGADGYVSSAAQTSDRVVLGSSNTGVIPYRIYYDSAKKDLTFTVKEADDDPDYRTVTYNLKSYFQRQTNTNLTLAFTYGAAYLNIDNFIVTSNNPYFTGQRTGQIDIWAKEMYAVPDLKTGMTEVRWLNHAYEKAGASTEKNAYYNGTSYVYTDKATWPVAGDRIYIQNNFTPRTSLDPPASSIQDGTLALSVENLSIKNTSGQAINGLSPPTPKLYYRLGDGEWIEYTNGSKITVSGTQTVYIRIEMTLPQLNDNSTEQYNVTGNIKGVYKVGTSTVTHTLDLMTENGKNITVSRNPMYIGFNGLDYYNNVRVIKSTENITQLKNISNGGNKDGVNSGDKTSLHYGSGYRPMSTGSSTASGDYYPMYQDRSGTESGTYDLKRVDLQSASMDSLSTVTTENDIRLDKAYNVDKSKDTRYILTYLIEDSVYSNKSFDLTQNTNRGKSTGKRVMWTSDNVEVQNGYEFYAKQNVTLALKDFEGFESSTDKPSYYRKIAEAAEAKVFKTSAYDFTDLINGNYTNNSQLSGNNKHQGIIDAVAKPGQAQPVEIKYTGDDGKTVVRTIQLTLTDDVKAVTLEDGTTVNDGANNRYTKVLVKTGTNHTFNVTATFKYDDTPENFEKIKEENGLFAALYQQDNSSNGDADGTGTFSFLKGSSNVTSPQSNTSLVTGPVISGLDEVNKTFTVTFTVTDNDNLTTANGYSRYNHKDYQIIAWTSANEATSFTNAGEAPDSFGDTYDYTKVPQVRSKVYVQKPIAVTANYDAQTVKFYENTGSFTTSFAYDARSEFTDNNDTVKYAIYRVQGGDNTLGVCEAGTINLTDGSVTRGTENRHFGNVENITPQLNEDEGKIQLTITLNQNEGRTRSTYRVYVWNDSNGDADLLQDDNSINADYRRNDPLKDRYPLSETKVLKIPKVYTQGTQETKQTEKNKLFYAQEAITISATFTLEGGSVSGGTQKETIGNLLDDKDNVGELKIALYKKNPTDEGEQSYQMFALAESSGTGDGSGTTNLSLLTSYKRTTVENAVIETNGDQSFTVTITKPIGDSQWDDGAKYCIYAWTEANETEGIPQDFGVGRDNITIEESAIKAINTIPSVETTMTEVLGEQVDKIIHYPKEITMTDNAGDTSRKISSGDQVISMTPTEDLEKAELPDTDMGVGVVIDELKTAASFNITREQKSIAVEGFSGTVGTGTNIGSNGRLGTLFFDTDPNTTKNRLLFYLQSQEEVNAADGEKYSGIIHFLFTKGSGTTN